jgi:hypothetical protein
MLRNQGSPASKNFLVKMFRFFEISRPGHQVAGSDEVALLGQEHPTQSDPNDPEVVPAINTRAPPRASHRR